MALLTPFSIALLLTSMFAFRFGTWRRPRLLAGYFLLFFSLEWAAERFLLPSGAVDTRIAWLFLPLAAVFAGASYLARRYESATAEADRLRRP
jgi:hypothetical protein